MRSVSRDRVMEPFMRRLELVDVPGLVSGLVSASSDLRFFVSSPLSAARIARRRLAAGSSGELSGTSMTSGDGGGGVTGMVCWGKTGRAQIVDIQLRCTVPHVVSLTISSYVPRERDEQCCSRHNVYGMQFTTLLRYLCLGIPNVIEEADHGDPSDNDGPPEPAGAHDLAAKVVCSDEVA